MIVFSTNGWRVVRIVSKQAWLNRDRCLLVATNLINVKMNTCGTVTPSRHVKKSYALCLLLATARASRKVRDATPAAAKFKPTPEMMEKRRFDPLR